MTVDFKAVHITALIIGLIEMITGISKTTTERKLVLRQVFSF
jgi:hypothetical protein